MMMMKLPMLEKMVITTQTRIVVSKGKGKSDEAKSPHLGDYDISPHQNDGMEVIDDEAKSPRYTVGRGNT